MGDPRKKRKSFEKPQRLWDKNRIEEEKALREEFGLKNSREVWKAKTILRKIRREARRLLAEKGAGTQKRAEQLVGRVKRFFVRSEDVSLDDILALQPRDVLERRLQTLVYRKGFARTASQARQLLTHGHIAVAGNKVSVPSYLVKFSEEEEIDWYGEPVETHAEPSPAEGAGEEAEEPGEEAEGAGEKAEEEKTGEKEAKQEKGGEPKEGKAGDATEPVEEKSGQGGEEKGGEEKTGEKEGEKKEEAKTREKVNKESA